MARTIRKFKETVDFQSQLIKRIRSHRYTPIALLVGALMTIACIHVWQRVHVISLVREVAELKTTNRDLLDAARKTQNEIAALSLGTRIEAYATDTLGMKTVTADNLFTLVRKRDKETTRDELATVLSSIGRVAHYLPALTEASANAGELRQIKFDSGSRGDSGE